MKIRVISIFNVVLQNICSQFYPILITIYSINIYLISITYRMDAFIYMYMNNVQTLQLTCIFIILMLLFVVKIMLPNVYIFIGGGGVF